MQLSLNPHMSAIYCHFSNLQLLYGSYSVHCVRFFASCSVCSETYYSLISQGWNIVANCPKKQDPVSDIKVIKLNFYAFLCFLSFVCFSRWLFVGMIQTVKCKLQGLAWSNTIRIPFATFIYESSLFQKQSGEICLALDFTHIYDRNIIIHNTHPLIL